MRKTSLAMALGLALSLGAAGAASAQSTQTQPPRAGQQGEHHGRGGRGDRDGVGRRGPEGMLLKGITLSDDQKARLKTLRQQSQNDAGREQFRAAMQEARDLRQKGDTTAARAKMQQLRAQFEQRREQQIASLRTILTPDQQRTLDANLAQMKQHEGERGQRGHRGEKRPA